MTVKELIAKLLRMPEDAKVTVSQAGRIDSWISDVFACKNQHPANEVVIVASDLGPPPQTS